MGSGCVVKLNQQGFSMGGFRVVTESEGAEMTLCCGHDGDPAPHPIRPSGLVQGAGGMITTEERDQNLSCLLSLG